MNITLFTSDNTRHNYLANLLSNISKNIFIVQEANLNNDKIKTNNMLKNKISSKYFDEGNKAQHFFFGNSEINKEKSNIKILSLPFGELNNFSLHSLSDFLKSDIYIIFGSSYIKGDLVDFLIKKKALNIHMGISPYYRGTDCNFWALYDNNPHLVGATIHILSKGIDNGPILYHALSKIKTNPFEYTMSAVKSSFYSILERLKDESIFKIKPIIQNKNKEIRYSKKTDFNDIKISEFFKKNINLYSKEFDLSLLKQPFFLDK